MPAGTGNTHLMASRDEPGKDNPLPQKIQGGRDSRTPVFAIGGTALVLVLLFLLALCLVLIGYLLGR